MIIKLILGFLKPSENILTKLKNTEHIPVPRRAFQKQKGLQENLQAQLIGKNQTAIRQAIWSGWPFPVHFHEWPSDPD